MFCSSIFLFAVYIIVTKLELLRAPCCSYASISRPKPFALANELSSKCIGHNGILQEYSTLYLLIDIIH